MNDNTNKDWVSVLKDRLENYAPDVPQMDFSQIEKKMLAAGAASKMAARRSRLNILKYAAAVAVVAAAGLLLAPKGGDKPLSEDAVAVTAEPQVVSQPSAPLAVEPETDKAEAPSQPVAAKSQKPTAQVRTKNTFIPTQPTPSANASETSAESASLLADASDAANKEPDPAAEQASATGQSSITVLDPGDLNDPDYKGNPFAEPRQERSGLGGRLALGASGILAANVTSTNQKAVPTGMMMFTDRNGNIYYSMGAPTAEYHYAAPISGGISIRYNFAGPFYAESGVRFTWLHTWVTPSGAVQDLLFAGIPVGLGVNMLQASGFNLYASLYGMPSKCIMGRESAAFPSNYSKLADIPIMWSAGASLGASYNFTPVFGIFAEPTLSYYFPNTKAPQTMFKENPYYFTLNVGVRFNFE